MAALFYSAAEFNSRSLTFSCGGKACSPSTLSYSTTNFTFIHQPAHLSPPSREIRNALRILHRVRTAPHSNKHLHLFVKDVSNFFSAIIWDHVSIIVIYTIHIWETAKVSNAATRLKVKMHQRENNKWTKSCISHLCTLHSQKSHKAWSSTHVFFFLSFFFFCCFFSLSFSQFLPFCEF